MKKARNYVINILLIVGFTAGVLWFTLKDNFNEVMGILTQVNFGWLTDPVDAAGSSFPFPRNPARA